MIYSYVNLLFPTKVKEFLLLNLLLALLLVLDLKPMLIVNYINDYWLPAKNLPYKVSHPDPLPFLF